MSKTNQINLEELEDYLREFSSSRINVVGRDEEINRLIFVVSRFFNNNALLVGQSGVGKTAVVKGLAIRIKNKINIPDYLSEKKIYQLDIVSLLSNTKFQGELESRIKRIFEFIKQENSIIFIDEFHIVTGLSSASKNQSIPDISNFLKTMVTDRNVCCIGATTIEEYRQYIQKDKALGRRFEVINVDELSEEATAEILKTNRQILEDFYGLKIEDDAIRASISLSSYFFGTYLPEKAITLLDKTCGRLRSEMWLSPNEIFIKRNELKYLKNEKEKLELNRELNYEEKIFNLEQKIYEIESRLVYLNEINKIEENRIRQITENKKRYKELIEIREKHKRFSDFDNVYKIEYEEILPIEKEIFELEKELKNNIFRKYFVTEQDIALTVAVEQRLSVDKLINKGNENLIFLPMILKKKIKGQNEAIRIVTDAIFRSSVGIQDPKRPFASFLFIGPTGVGKTKLSYLIAEQLFDKNSFLRLDMTEFSEPHSTSKLLGSPPGYIGFGNRSCFEFIKERKNSVILFDEIEKSHYDVINILLQIMDNGFVTVSDGTEIDFRSTIIILTTNLGYEAYKNYSGDRKELSRMVDYELNNFFRPEFLNRLDEKILFNSLDKDAVFEIISQELFILFSRVEKEQEILLDYDEEVKNKIFSDAYSLELGARPIKHYVEKEIGTLIAKGIISGLLKKRINYLLLLDNNKRFRISSLSLLED